MNSIKPNWEESKQHFIDFWNHDGLVVGRWAPARKEVPNFEPGDPGVPETKREQHENAEWRARSNHYRMAYGDFPLDFLPIAHTCLGPGTLATFIGAEPDFAERTIWYHPIWENVENPEQLPPIRFNPESHWWKVTERLLKESRELADGKYMVGCPDLIENIDILASLRDNQVMLMDMMMRPDWVYEKVMEINQAWFEAYDRIYEYIKLEDGSSAFGPFSVWGPGKTAKLQCDASAMIGPDMFEQFVAPSLQEQCEFLDHSIFHLDGHQCIPHLDILLGIEELDAIEWTPDPQVPLGDDPEWYPMYRKILEAGKSVQILVPNIDRVRDVLDNVGTKGVYLLLSGFPEDDLDELEKIIADYR
ncbi:MAG: hypothetical protein ACOC2L_03310 [Candidatus Sumerlaeota bacterium]